MKILNMVVPILMHFCSFISNLSVASHIISHIMEREVMSNKNTHSISKDLLFQIFDVIQSEVALQKQVH